MRGSKPVAKLVPIVQPVNAKRTLAGSYAGLISFDEKSFDPLTDQELKEYGFDALLNGELAPPPQP